MYSNQLKFIVTRCLQEQKELGMWKSCSNDGHPPENFYGLVRGNVYFYDVPTKIKDEKTVDLQLTFTAIYFQTSAIEESVQYSQSLDKAEIIEVRHPHSDGEEISLKELFEIDDPYQLKTIIKPGEWKYSYTDITHWVYAGDNPPFEWRFKNI